MFKGTKVRMKSNTIRGAKDLDKSPEELERLKKVKRELKEMLLNKGLDNYKEVDSQ